MAIIIGTDEAGYGPNLGPLVVAASAWRVPDALGVCDFYERLGSCICRRDDGHAARLPIADSKQLYKPGGTLAALERAVFVSLACHGIRVDCWRDVWTMLTGDARRTLGDAPWHANYDEPAPVDCTRDEIDALHDCFAYGRRQAEVELLAVRATAIFPAEFNREVRKLGSKGSLLTLTTLRLAEQLVGRHAAEPIFVLCDKHGGRNRYAAALQHVWPDSWINVIHEERARSCYRLTVADSEVEFRFAVGGESQLPTALASMTAKYLRELAMRALNAYWRAHVPDLRPTAGYPTDARRFKIDIAAAQRRLKIEDEVLWRCR